MTETCNQCSLPLDVDGNCQACLLRMGLSHAVAENAEGVSEPSLASGFEALAAQFPQLELQGMIGRGGMGAIYQARQKALDRDIALKVIAREVSGDTDFLERFEREAKTLARLSHPNIVAIYDYGHTQDNQAYLLMEFVNGCNLREAMERDPFSISRVIDSMEKICEALDFAHEKGVVHRDIKPENILLGQDGTLKVADFGIAKIVDKQMKTPTLTATRQVLGSINYLAPEHLEEPQEVDHRVDLYALGVVLYELLTGKLPIGRFDYPSTLNPSIDARFDDIVMKALAHDPAQRYQSAKELQQDLLELSREGEAPVITPEPQNDASVTLPFQTESHGGFAEVVGVMLFKNKTVTVEYRVRDAIFGGVKTDTKVINIPAERLGKIELFERWYGNSLILTADSISVFEDLPSAETGQFKVKVKRDDLERARDAIQALGRPHQLSGLRSALSNSGEVDESYWTTTAVFFLLAAGINAALLVACLSFLSQNHNNSLTLTARVLGIVFSSTIFGPIAVLQLLTGIFSFFSRPKALARTVAIVGILPIAPAWLFSCPTGIWIRYWLSDMEGSKQPHRPAPSQPIAPTANWTSATLVYLRENRAARWVAVLNALGIAVVALGLIVWRGGYYPTTMRFRIVNPEYHDTVGPQKFQPALLKALETRISSHRFSIQGSELRVYTVSASRAEVSNALAIESAVELAVAPNSSDAKLGALISSADLPEANRVQLKSNHVSGIRSPQTTELVLEFSKTGREVLASTQEATPGDKVLLIVDEVVVGLADWDDYRGNFLTMQLHDVRESGAQSALNSDAITAALRGNAIPTDLELLN